MTRRTAAVAMLLAGAVTLTGCTSSASKGHGAAAGNTTPTVSGVPTDTGIDTGVPVPTDSTTPTTSAPATPSTSTVALPADTCRGPQLTLRLIRGGAIPLQEIALITFTNTGTTECSMFGFPGVSLRAAGKQLGQALRSPIAAKTVRLMPGEQAQAQITDFSSCQAPLSDTVRIYPPNLTTYVDKPFELRACRFQVDPVSHS